MGCVLWEHQGEVPNSSWKGQEAFARVATEKNCKKFLRLRAICQRCGTFWTKKWKIKYTAQGLVCKGQSPMVKSAGSMQACFLAYHLLVHHFPRLEVTPGNNNAISPIRLVSRLKRLVHVNCFKKCTTQ